jgi:nucleotide sugar dehydrogenase
MRVVVIGGGRIGLPMAVTAANAGHRVSIVDIAAATIDSINAGRAPFDEPGMGEDLANNVASGVLDATLSPAAVVGEAAVVLCAIGTGLCDDGTPDLSNLESFIESIGTLLNSGTLVVFKTTLPIGTTETLAEHLARASGMTLDEGLMVCFSPERIVEGKAMHEMKTLPKIIGGIGPNSTAAGAAFYETIGGKIITVSNTRTAELCKLLDNSYRMTRFGFSSDIAALARANEIDAYEAISAANKDYARNSIPLPSMGVSGYCLTKDPLYLDMAAGDLVKRRGFPTVWMAARRAADDLMITSRDAILASVADIENPVIVVGGITYKENVQDVRESHGLNLAIELRHLGEGSGNDAGMLVRVWDPCLGQCSVSGFDVEGDASEVLVGADMLVITVPHSDFVNLANDRVRLVNSLGLMRSVRIHDGWGIFRSSILPVGTHYEGCGIAPPK